MSVAFLAAVVLAAMPGDGGLTGGGSPVVVEQPAAAPRTGGELRAAVREAMGRWARPADDEAELAARELLALYGELQADDRLARAQRRELLAKLRSRLLELAEQISRHAAAQQPAAEARQAESADVAGGAVLAQAGGRDQLGGLAGLLPGGQPGAAAPARAARGGRAGMIGGGQVARPGGAAYDNGQALVELIQQTVAPETWDVNGGRGTIYYWRPGRALVVRQTGGVHQSVEGLLQMMDRMGR